MLFPHDKAVVPRRPDPQTQVRPAADMRTGLGLVHGWQLSHAERKAKKEAAITLAQRAMENSLDVATFELDIQATQLKAALLAQSAPTMGAILSELVSRSAQVTMQIGAVQGQGIFHETTMRADFLKEVQKRRAAGQLTDDEAAELCMFFETQMQQGLARLNRNAQRAQDALESYVARATELSTLPKQR